MPPQREGAREGARGGGREEGRLKHRDRSPRERAEGAVTPGHGAGAGRRAGDKRDQRDRRHRPGRRVRASGAPRRGADGGSESGTAGGARHGKIWRIGAMGYNARKDAILRTLSSLGSVLRLHGLSLPKEDGALAALEVYRAAEKSAAS